MEIKEKIKEVIYYEVDGLVFEDLNKAKKYNELISKYNFDEKQKRKIELGLNINLDIDLYAKPEFTHWQMNEIIKGLRQRLITLN